MFSFDTSYVFGNLADRLIETAVTTPMVVEDFFFRSAVAEESIDAFKGCVCEEVIHFLVENEVEVKFVVFFFRKNCFDHSAFLLSLVSFVLTTYF